MGGQDSLRSLQTEIRLQAQDYEERTIAVSDTLLACLKYRGKAPNDTLIFPSPATQTVDKHLDRIINRLSTRRTMRVTWLRNRRNPPTPFACCTLRGGISRALTSKPCGRNLGIPTSQPLKSTCARRTPSPIDIARASTRRTGSLGRDLGQLFCCPNENVVDNHLRTSRCARNSSTAASRNRRRFLTRM